MRVLECFAGIGGFALAWERLGFEHVAFIERDRFCQAVLRKHWPNVPIYDDIKSFSGTSLRGRVDLVSGGPPCQPASVAGRRKGSSDERWLWPDFLRVVRECAPRWVVAENPTGIRTLAPHGSDWIISEMEEMGYSVLPAVVGAWAAGAPHKRERVWIVAHKHGNGQYRQRSGGVLDGERAASGHDAYGRGERPVGEPTGSGLEGQRADAGEPQVAQPRDASPRWPARPGEPQHEWECARLAQFGVGASASRLQRRRVQHMVVTDGTTGEDGPIEILRLLSAIDEAETLQRPHGGHGRISEATLLRLTMHGRRQNDSNSGPCNPSWASTASGVAQGEVSGMRINAASPASPHKQGHDGQPAGERLYPLRFMPRERPLEEREAAALLRALRRWNRESLKAIGNSVVPSVVEAIGYAILEAEEGLK